MSDFTVWSAVGLVGGLVAGFLVGREAKRPPPVGVERPDCMRFIPQGAAVEAYWLGYEDGKQDANELPAGQMYAHAESRGPIHLMH